MINAVVYLWKSYLGNVSIVSVLITFIVLFELLEYFIKEKDKDNKLFKFLFSMYLTFVVSITLLGREPGMVATPFGDLFSTYTSLINEVKIWKVYEIVFNIVMFIPFGGFIAQIMKNYKRALVYSFTFSVLIEIVQAILHLGMFEICDIFHNCLGGLIGAFFIYRYRIKNESTYRRSWKLLNRN